jgi:hypothetical protein
VDDFVFLRSPLSRSSDGTFDFRYSADLIWQIADNLGWPWAPEKFVDFSTTFNYIGFKWDLSAKVVELPEKKKAKYLERISTWTRSSTHTLKEAEIIIGTLNHVSLVIPEGRSHLVSLYRFRGGFKDHGPAELKHKLSTSAAEDINWWRLHLQSDFLGMKIVRPPEPLDNSLCVDASTT